jgi:hypothetical protein
MSHIHGPLIYHHKYHKRQKFRLCFNRTTKYGFQGANPFLGTRAEYRQKCTRFSTMPGAVRTHMAVLTVPHGSFNGSIWQF